MARGFVDRQLPILGEPVAQRVSLRRRRGEVGPALQRAGLAHRHDPRIAQRHDALQRLQHPRVAAQARETRTQHVQLDRPGVPPVARGEGEQQGALAGLVAHLVALGEAALHLLQLARRRLAARLGAGGDPRPRWRRGRGALGRHLTGAEPPDPGLDLRVGLRLQMLADERAVHPGELQGAGPVPGGDERLDQPDGGGRC